MDQFHNYHNSQADLKLMILTNMYVPRSDDVLAIRDYPESELEKITFKSTNDQEEDKDNLPYGLLDCISHGSLYEAVIAILTYLFHK